MPLNINWQQILLHLFNFFLLLAILTFFIYNPVLQFIKKREDHYKEMDEKAKAKLTEAEKVLEDNKKKFKDIDNEIDERRNEKMAELSEIIDKRMKDANLEVERIVNSAKERAEREHDKILEQANHDIELLAMSMTSKLVHKRENDEYDEFIEYYQRGDDTDE